MSTGISFVNALLCEGKMTGVLTSLGDAFWFYIGN